MVKKKSNKCVYCGKKKLVMFLAVYVLIKKPLFYEENNMILNFFTFITAVPRVSGAAFAIWFPKS